MLCRRFRHREDVWLALTWAGHPQHSPAASWYRSVKRARLWFCRFTMLGLLRLLTNPQVMGDSTVTVGGALELYDEWRRDPRVGVAPEPAGAELLFREAAPFSRSAAHKAIADCYLVGFAEASGAGIVTFDCALARTAESRQVAVTLLWPA